MEIISHKTLIGGFYYDKLRESWESKGSFSTI